MNISKALSELLSAYDEATNMCRVTSGETLAYWVAKREEAEDGIRDIVDDQGAIECARHMV